jgi:hypothetical protein
MGRIGEAANDARRSLALARQGDDHLAEALALAVLGLVACVAGSHLDRIRDKTGCRRRADLTRLALGAGLV